MDELDDGTGETIAPCLTRADALVEDEHNTCAPREYALLPCGHLQASTKVVSDSHRLAAVPVG